MKKQIYVTVIVIICAAMLLPLLPLPAAAKTDDDRPPYYLEENSSRYEAYQARNPDIPFDIIIAYVNAGTDKEPYDDIVTITNPTSYSAFVSKNSALPTGYAPSDLVTLPGGGLLRKKAAAAFMKMRAAAAEEGLTLVVRSSYRSYYDQVASYDLVMGNYGRDAAEASVARPNHSEHQLGLALDIVHREGTSGPLTVQGFDESREYPWLLEHGYEYGFIQRYPANFMHIQGFVYEPWHWRYVGIMIATRMHNKGITTLEEYYGKYLSPQVLAHLQQGRILRPRIYSGTLIAFTK